MSKQLAGKEALYQQLAHQIEASVTITKEGRVSCNCKAARSILISAVRGLLMIAAVEGKVHLPAGLGSFTRVAFGARQQRTPCGKVVTIPSRYKIRLNQGVELQKLVKLLSQPSN